MGIFVSYSHRQGDWVWNRLVPVLKAGGAELLIDRERFEAGKDVGLQAERLQKAAAKHLLVLSDSYAASRYCMDELRRAVRTDPRARAGTVIVLRRDLTPVPAEIPGDSLRVELQDEGDPHPWELLLKACGAGLGATAPAWLAARDEVAAELRRHKSVNLVVLGKDIRWRELLADVRERAAPDLALVDMKDGRTEIRPDFLLLLLQSVGSRIDALPRQGDLGRFTHEVLALGRKLRVGLIHFDEIRQRRYHEAALYSGLRYLVTEGPRPLTLLIQSRASVASLQPAGPDESDLASALTTVELR